MANDIPVGVTRIVSGGQTGVDRGALDAAIGLGIEHGGWCPRGRLAEDGVIPEQYALTETRSYAYRVRTERNVLDSDATLILYKRTISGGTQFTRYMAMRHGKPFLAVNLEAHYRTEDVRRWIERYRVRTLNVAGPRESTSPGIQELSRQLLMELLGER